MVSAEENDNKQPVSPRTMKAIAAEMTEMHYELSCHPDEANKAVKSEMIDRSKTSQQEDSSDESIRSSSSSDSYTSIYRDSYGSSDTESFSSESVSSDSSDSCSSDEDDQSSSANHEKKIRSRMYERENDNPDANAFRRRRHMNNAQDPHSNNMTHSNKVHDDKKKQPSKRKPKSYSQQINCHLLHSAKSTKLLYLSFIFWSAIQFYIIFNHTSLYKSIIDGVQFVELIVETRGLSGREKKAWIRDRDRRSNDRFSRFDLGNSPTRMEQLRQEAKIVLGSAAEDDLYYRQSGKPNTKRKRRSKSYSDEEGSTRTERLRDGCAPLEWHSYHFPNCNEIHEIDLRGIVRKRKFGVDIRRELDDNSLPWGFVGNGLWRDVFSCDPHQEVDSNNMPPAVLKMMKSEHPFDQRNFQRHRRDALVMELLSSSQHLVPIYGYCANTVMTQAISHTLDDVIYAREKESVKTWTPDEGYKMKLKLESWMGKDENGDLLATRETEIGRIRLALGVFRGLMDLHEGVGYKNKDGKAVEWLPIIHADLQAKQYLVDATTGQVYLNDFNRCRFVTKKDNNVNSSSDISNASVLESCPVYIPTSPGASRSPEEYDSAPLSEKIDVYSAGNILYGIITGERPWNNERGKHIKSSIQKGDRPKVDMAIRNAVGTVDAELTRILDKVYEGDPMKRANAKEIVNELEIMLDAQLQDNKDQ
jgi:serine/threonine protein kinase